MRAYGWGWISAGALLFSAPLSWAGNETGNGGDALVCRNSRQQITSVELLDFYEARARYGIQVSLGSDSLSVKEKLELALSRLGRLSPERAALYREQAMRFEVEALFVPNANLVDIPDSDHVAIPNGCKVEQLVVHREPQFPGEKRYTVNQDLWSLMDATNQAGAILHEVVYREALSYRHKNSIFARYFSGIISSERLATASQIEFLALMSLVKFQRTDLALIPGRPFRVHVGCEAGHAPPCFEQVSFYPSGQLKAIDRGFVLHDFGESQLLDGFLELWGVQAKLVLKGEAAKKPELHFRIQFHENGQLKRLQVGAWGLRWENYVGAWITTRTSDIGCSIGEWDYHGSPSLELVFNESGKFAEYSCFTSMKGKVQVKESWYPLFPNDRRIGFHPNGALSGATIQGLLVQGRVCALAKDAEFSSDGALVSFVPGGHQGCNVFQVAGSELEFDSHERLEFYPGEKIRAGELGYTEIPMTLSAPFGLLTPAPWSRIEFFSDETLSSAVLEKSFQLELHGQRAKFHKATQFYPGWRIKSSVLAGDAKLRFSDGRVKSVKRGATVEFNDQGEAI